MGVAHEVRRVAAEENAGLGDTHERGVHQSAASGVNRGCAWSRAAGIGGIVHHPVAAVSKPHDRSMVASSAERQRFHVAVTRSITVCRSSIRAG
jgi:hypothetical protein